MIANIDFISKTFDKLNAKFFNGKLPRVSFELSNRKRAIGDFNWVTRTIRISTFFDRSEFEHENTILHEMCHLWQYENYGKCDHGKTFRIIANIIYNIDPRYIITRTGSATVINSELTKTNKIEDFLIWDYGCDKIAVAKIDINYIDNLTDLITENVRFAPVHICINTNTNDTFKFRKNRVNIKFNIYGKNEFKQHILPHVDDVSVNIANQYINQNRY